jgi:cell fate regulator YaaT (PSP1 superfamily)
MCCLRYEDQTYEELRKRLPKNKSRVGTPDGPGTVIDSKILVQLVLVRLEHNGQDVAVPVEDLTPVDGAAPPPADTI